MQQTSDGGYVIAGWTNADETGDMVDREIYVLLIKTDSDGNELWSKTFGGSGMDDGRSVQQTSDGGYVIAGYTDSYGAGSVDVWLIKTDPEGNKEWDKTFGGSNHDQGNSLQQTSDGGYVIGGLTNSYGAGPADVWLLKVTVAE